MSRQKSYFPPVSQNLVKSLPLMLLNLRRIVETRKYSHPAVIAAFLGRHIHPRCTLLGSTNDTLQLMEREHMQSEFVKPLPQVPGQC